MFTIKINGIYLHHVNIIFLLVLICLLVDAVPLFISPASADLFVVVDPSAHCALLSIDCASMWWMAGTTVTTFFHGILVFPCSHTPICLCTLLPVLILSNLLFHLTCSLWLIRFLSLQSSCYPL